MISELGAWSQFGGVWHPKSQLWWIRTWMGCLRNCEINSYKILTKFETPVCSKSDNCSPSIGPWLMGGNFSIHKSWGWRGGGAAPLFRGGPIPLLDQSNGLCGCERRVILPHFGILIDPCRRQTVSLVAFFLEKGWNSDFASCRVIWVIASFREVAEWLFFQGSGWLVIQQKQRVPGFLKCGDRSYALPPKTSCVKGEIFVVQGSSFLNVIKGMEVSPQKAPQEVRVGIHGAMEQKLCSPDCN